jgi:hypothetical protein
MVRAFRRAAVLAAAILAAASCAPVVHGRPISDTEIAQHIALALQPAQPVFIGVHDLALDVPLRTVLRADGLVAGSGSSWTFTSEGLRASRPCPTADRAERCFRVDEKRFTSVVRTSTSDGGLDGEPHATSIFAYRAAPNTTLGEHLARAGVLRCGASPGHAVQWRGVATAAQGVFNISTRAGSSDSGTMLDDFCPHTRLQNGVLVHFMLDNR